MKTVNANRNHYYFNIQCPDGHGIFREGVLYNAPGFTFDKAVKRQEHLLEDLVCPNCGKREYVNVRKIDFAEAMRLNDIMKRSPDCEDRS